MGTYEAWALRLRCLPATAYLNLPLEYYSVDLDFPSQLLVFGLTILPHLNTNGINQELTFSV